MNQQDLTAYEALTKRHALLKKKFELLEQQEKAIFSDKTIAMDGIPEKLIEELADAENDLALPSRNRAEVRHRAYNGAASEEKSKTRRWQWGVSRKKGECMKDQTGLFARSDTDLKIASDLERSEALDTAFKDIQGQDSALQAAKEYLFSLLYRANAKGVGGSIFPMGAPAVGKTIMAEGIAKGSGRPYLYIDGSSFHDKESYLDLFGLNPSYNNSQAGLLTSFIE